MLQKFLIIFFVSCGLISCTPVSVEPVNRYMIDKVPCVAPQSRANTTLLVLLPDTQARYNTSLMAYTICPYQIDYFVKNQWAETPAQMLTPLMVQTLQNTHRFKVVSSSGDYGQYDFILNSQLIELVQVFSCNCSYVRLKINVQWVNAVSNKLVGSKQFCLIEPAPCPTPYGGVIAANRATQRFLEQLAVSTVNILPRF